MLEGEYAGDLIASRTRSLPSRSSCSRAGTSRRSARPRVVPAIRRARAELPDLRAVIFGDGPDRPAVLAAIRREGMEEAIDAPGFAPSETVEATLRRALCMVLPSRREGYGLIVVEAAAAGVPSVVVREPDNAAVELVEDGVNGFVAESPEPHAIADAIVRVARRRPGAARVDRRLVRAQRAAAVARRVARARGRELRASALKLSVREAQRVAGEARRRSGRRARSGAPSSRGR